jgi:hypothetical protein
VLVFIIISSERTLYHRKMGDMPTDKKTDTPTTELTGQDLEQAAGGAT